MNGKKIVAHDRLYRIGAVFTFGLFLGIMVGVVIIGFKRQSGVTGMDVSKMVSHEETVEQLEDKS